MTPGEVPNDNTFSDPGIPTAAGAVSALPSVNMVVVDDDSLVLEYFRRALRKSDIPVRTFIDGEEALAELLDRPATLLFVDSRMPLIDGIEVLEQLHAAGALHNTSAYLCSAARPPDDIYARAEALDVAVLLKDMQTDKAFLAVLLKNAERKHAQGDENVSEHGGDDRDDSQAA